MSITFEDENGTVQAMRKREIARVTYSGQDAGGLNMGSIYTGDENETTSDVFKTKEALMKHVRNFTTATIAGSKLTERQRERIFTLVEQRVEKIADIVLSEKNIDKLNRSLQSVVLDELCREINSATRR